MEKLKTFQTILDEGYVYPDIIPATLQETLNEWFQFRYVCDNNKFAAFYNRVLKRDYPRYYQLLRIEPNVSEYDWLVTQYHELQKTDTETRTETGTGTESGTATHSTSSTDENTKTITYNSFTSNTLARENDGATTISEHIVRDDDATTNRTDVTDTDTTDNNVTDVKSAERALPMSAYAVGTDTDGRIGSLLWDTASGQAQNTTRSDTKGTVDTTLTVTGSDNLDSDTTRSETQQNSGGYSDTGTGSKTGTDTTSRETENTLNGSTNGTTREIRTGHEGQIANILENAKSFILSTNAFTWYKNQLETCFMGVLDYE